MTQHSNRSILDRIKSAKTREQIDSLLDEADEYEFPREKTRRRWSKYAAIRKSQIDEQ